MFPFPTPLNKAPLAYFTSAERNILSYLFSTCFLIPYSLHQNTPKHSKSHHTCMYVSYLSTKSPQADLISISKAKACPTCAGKQYIDKTNSDKRNRKNKSVIPRRAQENIWGTCETLATAACRYFRLDEDEGSEGSLDPHFVGDTVGLDIAHEEVAAQ